MNTAALKSYVPLIESETKNYFARWEGDTGKSDISVALAELTIMTASRCLMGKEIRSQLDEKGNQKKIKESSKNNSTHSLISLN